MEKRRISFGTYDTAANGWTLTGWQLSPAEEKTSYVDVPGADGSVDLSTSLTGGVATYHNRELVATFECSDGDRLSREARIRAMVNALDGTRVDIELPDDPNHHINGRVHVAREYNDLAHCAVTVTAVCKPWKESNAETVITLTASTTKRTARLINNGRRASVPLLTVTGTSANLLLAYGSASKAFSAGTYKWPDLFLTPGAHELTYSGAGTLAITYREAVLE